MLGITVFSLLMLYVGLWHFLCGGLFAFPVFVSPSLKLMFLLYELLFLLKMKLVHSKSVSILLMIEMAPDSLRLIWSLASLIWESSEFLFALVLILCIDHIPMPERTQVAKETYSTLIGHSWIIRSSPRSGIGSTHLTHVDWEMWSFLPSIYWEYCILLW